MADAAGAIIALISFLLLLRIYWKLFKKLFVISLLFVQWKLILITSFYKVLSSLFELLDLKEWFINLLFISFKQFYYYYCCCYYYYYYYYYYNNWLVVQLLLLSSGIAFFSKLEISNFYV